MKRNIKYYNNFFFSLGLKIGNPARQNRQNHRLACMSNDPSYKDACVEDEHKAILDAHHRCRQELLDAAREHRMDHGMYDYEARNVYKECMALNQKLRRLDDPTADIPSGGED